MKNKLLLIIIVVIFLSSCVGTSSTGIFGTGVTVALDPRTLGTQIDDSIMDKSLDAKILSTGGVHEVEFFQLFFTGMNQALFLDTNLPNNN